MIIINSSLSLKTLEKYKNNLKKKILYLDSDLKYKLK